jgi:hypothetical protein
MTGYLNAATASGIARLRCSVAGLFVRLECGCAGGVAIDGNCMDCGAPSLH